MIFSKIDKNFSKYQIEILRISIAIFAIVNHLLLITDYDIFFSSNGLINWEVSNAGSFWFEIHPYKIAKYLNVSNEYVFPAISFFYLISLMCIIIGYSTRIFSILSLLCYVTITNTISDYCYGVDVYLTVVFLYLSIVPSGYNLTFVNKNNCKNSKYVNFQQIGIRGLQLYLGITYLSAGIEKAFAYGWWNGEFIFLILSDPTIVSKKNIFLGFDNWCYTLVGIIVVFTEALYLIYIWVPILRVLGITIIIFMHLFIAVQMQLTSFGILLIILNVVLWYPAFYTDFKNYNYEKL